MSWYQEERPRGGQSKEHKAIRQAICSANPGTYLNGFMPALVRRFFESGEAAAINGQTWHMEGVPESIADAGDVIRGLTKTLIPDAWSLPSDHPMVIVWEVSVGSIEGRVVRKWEEFLYEVLDVTGNFSFALICVTESGMCHVPLLETFDGWDPRFDPHNRRMIMETAWPVYNPCPIDWKRCIGYDPEWLENFIKNGADHPHLGPDEDDGETA